MRRAGRFNSPLPFMGEGLGEKAKQKAPSPHPPVPASHIVAGVQSAARQRLASLPPSPRKRARGFIGVVLFSLLSVTAYATDKASLSQQIATCSLQTDNSERLACYDQLATGLNTVALSDKTINSAGSEPINEDNALFKLSCAYFAKDC